MESIIKIKQNEKMYVVLPFTTVNCPHKLPSLVDLSNYVCMNILEDTFPDYTMFDHAVKKLFKKEGAVVSK